MIAGELLGFSVNVSESSSNAGTGMILFSALFLSSASFVSDVACSSSSFASVSSGGFASMDSANFLSSAVLSPFPVSSLVTRSKKRCNFEW